MAKPGKLADPILSAPGAVAVAPVSMPVGWHYPPHRHDDFCQMLLVHRGRVRVRIGGAEVVGGPGQTLLYVAGATHEEWNATGEPVEATYFGFTWPDPAPRPGRGRHAPARSVAAPDVPILGSDRAGRIGMLARWMVDLAPRLPPARRGLLGALMHAFLIEHAAAPTPPAAAPDDLVARVHAYVHARPGRRPRLDDLADAAGVSRFHFAHAFRAAAGVAPVRYARRVRLEAAHGLLVSTTLPLKQVAVRTGFADAYAFAKAFHREYGRWPSSVRRSPGDSGGGGARGRAALAPSRARRESPRH